MDLPSNCLLYDKVFSLVFFFWTWIWAFSCRGQLLSLFVSISFPSSQMKDIGYNMAACLTRLIIDKVFVSSCNVFFFSYKTITHLAIYWTQLNQLTPHLQVNWTHTSMQLGFSATNIIQVELTSGTLFPADIWLLVFSLSCGMFYVILILSTKINLDDFSSLLQWV